MRRVYFEKIITIQFSGEQDLQFQKRQLKKCHRFHRFTQIFHTEYNNLFFKKFHIENPLGRVNNL